MEFVLYAGLIAIVPVAWLLGAYMKRVFEGQKHPLSFLSFIERGVYRLLGTGPEVDMDWKAWLKALTVFTFAGIAFLFAILMGQAALPLNPQHFAGMSWDLALNTAVSFVTNTNWQAYSGESSLSYTAQMVGLTVQNFVSAAVGIVIALALVRGLRARFSAGTGLTNVSLNGNGAGLGNFWVDLTRTILYVLLPLSIIVALILAGQGVVQNLNLYQPMTGLAGQQDLIPMGPAASQISIKQLGSNGGGFFGVNSAHPFENPTPFSNLVEFFSILLIPMALPFVFGRMLGKKKQGWTLFGVMMGLMVILIIGSLASESVWGNMEGKEMRFGSPASILWSVATTVTSNGSVNAMHDSLSPLSGMVAMFAIMLGEVVFGGVGSGIYGIVTFVILTIFLVGLMVGRTPEYLGKKIGAREVILSMTAILLPSLAILIPSAIAVLVPAGYSAVGNAGPHGLSEILYAYSSGAGNNGSAFGGLSVNTPYWNVSMTIAMLIGRFGVIVPVLALAGGLAVKKTVAESTATFPTDTALFGVMLAMVIIIVGGLTHFPALVLGPILDHALVAGGVAL